MINERSFLIRCVVAFYAAGVLLFTIDLGVCEVRRPGTCDSTRGRLEGAITAGPAALLALLVRPTSTDNPSTPDNAPSPASSPAAVRRRSGSPDSPEPEDEALPARNPRAR